MRRCFPACSPVPRRSPSSLRPTTASASVSLTAKRSTLVFFFFFFSRWQPPDCTYLQSGLFSNVFLFSVCCLLCFSFFSRHSGTTDRNWRVDHCNRTSNPWWPADEHQAEEKHTIRVKDGAREKKNRNTPNSVFPIWAPDAFKISLCIYFVPLRDSLAGKRCTMFISWLLIVCCLLLGRWLTVGVWRDLAGSLAPGCGCERHGIRGEPGDEDDVQTCLAELCRWRT